jgi:tetratricopeptide (TPR) repeat protein
MRLIRGDSLKQAIERFHATDAKPRRDRLERTLAMRGLLNRFVAVCEAVAYAHSRGVVHRDLKPSNVMLGPYGETLVVDWGLAKVVGRDDPITSPEATLRPASALATGSSETQAGTVVGTPAYMSPEQAEGRLEAIGPASDVYSLGATLYCLSAGLPPITADDALGALSKAQRGEFPPPREVNKRVPSGLEAIVLKAMANRPCDRYASARELARDVEHWLADEPVSAYRDPWTVRSWRWARRHRTLVSAVAVLLVASVVALSVGAALLQRARLETVRERIAAETARQRSDAINRFLVDDLLKQFDPVNNPVGDQLTVGQLLDKAAAKLVAGARGNLDPEVEAEIRSVVGHAYEYLRADAKAEPHYRRSWELHLRLLGPKHPKTLAARNRYVFTIVVQERIADAEPLAVGSVEICERALGDNHSATADALNILAELRLQQARRDESISLRRRASEIALNALGSDNDLTLEIDNNLAASLVLAGKATEGAELLRSVVERRRRVTPRHPELGNALANLGATMVALGQFAAAEAILKDAVELNTQLSGPLSLVTLSARNACNYAIEGQSRWDEAERRYLAVLADRRSLDGGKAPGLGSQRTLAFLARLYAKEERWADSARLVAEIILAQHPDSRQKPDVLAASLKSALDGTADPGAAVPLLAKCREALEVPLWAGDWFAAEIASRQGDCLRRLGRFPEAESMLVDAAKQIQTSVGAPPWGNRAARKRVAELYAAWSKPAEAANWR